MGVAVKEISMASRIRIRAQKTGDFTEVKTLMRHPMETGMRKDEVGNIIPARFITEIAIVHEQQPVMKAHWGAAVSANPFLGIRFKGGEVGDTVRVKWLDNQGLTGKGETNIR